MSSNSSCPTETASQSPPPLFQNGKIVFQAYNIGWITASLFTIIATVVSFWLVNKHLQWYTNELEQRYIVRILLMIPIYAIVSLSSYFFMNDSTPILLIRDCYESTVLTSFFYLILLYVSPDPEEQKEVFRKVGLSKHNDTEAMRRNEPVKKWVFPLFFIKWKPEDGWYFLQIMKWGILQYCVIRPLSTLIALMLIYTDLYCEDSYSPGWGHVWITTIVSISVTVAMYCLIQLYVPIADILAPQKPVLKLLAIKAVVFLTFWQSTLLSVLNVLGFLTATTYLTEDQLDVTIGALLETFEMAIFAFIHIKAFSYKPYLQLTKTARLKALRHAMDFSETFHEIREGYIYLKQRMHGQETDHSARRMLVMKDAFGRERLRVRDPGEKPIDNQVNHVAPGVSYHSNGVMVQVESEVDISGERQWLGVGNEYGYGLGSWRRERSAALEDQIETELEKRGYPRQDISPPWSRESSFMPTNDLMQGLTESEPHSRQRSWWRGVYDRISHSSHDDEGMDDLHVKDASDHAKINRHGSSKGSSVYPLYDDPPPSSKMQTYRTPAVHPIGLQSLRAVEQDHLDPRARALTDKKESSLPQMFESSPPTKAQNDIDARDRPTLKHTDSFFGRVFPPSPTDTDLASTNDSGGTVTAPSHSWHSPPTVGSVPFMTPRLVSPDIGLPMIDERIAIARPMSSFPSVAEPDGAFVKFGRTNTGAESKAHRGVVLGIASNYAREVRPERRATNNMSLEAPLDYFSSNSSRPMQPMNTPIRSRPRIVLPTPLALAASSTSPVGPATAFVEPEHMEPARFTSTSPPQFSAMDSSHRSRPMSAPQGLRSPYQPHARIPLKRDTVNRYRHTPMSPKQNRSSARRFSAPLDSRGDVWWKSGDGEILTSPLQVNSRWNPQIHQRRAGE